MPRYSAENFSKNLKFVDELTAVAKEKGCTTSQLVLQWLMRQGEDIIPIPGTKRIKYLEENMGALDVVLSDEEVKRIREMVEKCEIQGGRYMEAMLTYCFADTPPL